jgi:hypothetical protein
MDTSSRDVAQIWIVEEATDQIAEFLQPAHGSNGFAFEVPLWLGRYWRDLCGLL